MTARVVARFVARFFFVGADFAGTAAVSFERVEDFLVVDTRAGFALVVDFFAVRVDFLVETVGILDGAAFLLFVDFLPDDRIAT